MDLEKLREFGTDLTAEVEAGRISRAHGTDEACEMILRVLLGKRARGVVLLGEPGAGKTALVGEITRRLLDDPRGAWRVLRVSAGDFLSGTRYLGEWETRVKELVQAIRAPNRVLLYVPDVDQLSNVGRSLHGDLNVASMLAPHIEGGAIALIGESTPEAFRAGLGKVGSLRRIFTPIELRGATTEETLEILARVGQESGLDLPPSFLSRLMELADFYHPGTALPGRAVGLLRRVLDVAAPRGDAPTTRDVLATLSASTGIPVDFLDDAVPLDLVKARDFFEARVMGQPEAVSAVVDLVALVKAGLTDPEKPFGVLFFVGPTGVGKTELARALAEFLFGNANRLLRFDMSEFATFDAFERLIGAAGEPGLLTSIVREHPFAVVLFDEIEKAHLNVFDLCLQIFDAGRLTDASGKTADFRRTIVILTSNVGSAASAEAMVGFSGKPAPPPDRDAVLKELRRFFRPEFLNRLDRIVTFRPLALETAERIARREVARVVERSGLARRSLSVDIEPAVLALLLREGYSPAFGARPLKRTVERMVLLPVARAIASGNVPSGSVLRLVAQGARVAVEIIPPETAAEAAGEAPEERLAADRDELVARAETLRARTEVLRPRSAAAAGRKSELLKRTAAPGFWKDRPAAQRAMDEIHRFDGVLKAMELFDRNVRNVLERAGTPRPSQAHLAQIQERVESLEREAGRVEFLLGLSDPRDLGDAFVTLTRVGSRGADLDAVGRLAGMYLGFAEGRGLKAEVLDDRRGGEPPEDTATLLVSGAGAHAFLSGESGLHQLSRGWTEKSRGRAKKEDRDVARVEVLPVPADDPPFAKGEVRVEARALKGQAGRLIRKPRLEVSLLHEPSMAAARAWTDASKDEAVEKLTLLLKARVAAGRSPAAAQAPAGADPIVRRYVLGPAPAVRDRRTGRSTFKLDRVLRGDLDLFLTPPPGPGAEGGPSGMAPGKP